MTCGGTGGEKIASRKATRAAAREAGALMGAGAVWCHPQRKQKLKLTMKGIEGGRLKANKVLCARAQVSCSPTVALPEGIPLPPPLQCRRLALCLGARQRQGIRAKLERDDIGNTLLHRNTLDITAAAAHRHGQVAAALIITRVVTFFTFFRLRFAFFFIDFFLCAWRACCCSRRRHACPP